MGLKIGNGDIKRVSLGSTPVKAIYKGAKLVWSSKTNLWKGDWSQFDNQGGEGTVYVYFKLPKKARYELKVTAKNDVTTTGGTLLTLSNFGGKAGGDGWAGFIISARTWSAGETVSSENGAWRNNSYEFVTMYERKETTFNFLNDNFIIEIYEIE